MVRDRAVTCRSEAAEAARKAENERTHGPWRERAEKTLTEPATGKQISYLNKLVAQVARTLRRRVHQGRQEHRHPAASPGERAATVTKRLTEAAARKLVTALAGRCPPPSPARP
ncbi:hypothetical protein [Streptomyces antibioticus]|uniref:hypothetical protein n=1 Tax=Streptomyces antibioticus TaxID=1890 RepID=UPI00225B99E0|nr:hypothetical protein [Streptomyces antibioticus]MCX4740916.1 hypothetical protein [Streptomyces antibioticus]